MSIADTEEYKDFEMKHNRHLNMLGDSVSLNTIISYISFNLLFFEKSYFYAQFIYLFFCLHLGSQHQTTSIEWVQEGGQR